MAKSGSAILRVGDVVLFYFNSVEKNGYVYAELSSSPFNFLTLLQSSSNNPQFSNVNFATFQVLAPMKYQATQRLKDLKEHESCPENEIINAQRALDKENAENMQEQKRRSGTAVLYGDLVQLLHVGSKKYVTVCSEASRTESNNLLVNLSQDNSVGTIFRILPRYKVRSEGDGIHYHDQIKLVSFKTQGQVLHIGARSLDKAGYKAIPNCYEVNLSGSESAFALKPHSVSQSLKNSPNALRGGKCVRLFHKEDECYIVAEGSFASPTSPVYEDVHCRLRRVGHSKSHSMPSTSANTFWQIEKVDTASVEKVNATSGDVISWGEPCHIKHMPTRMYLSIDCDLQVKLKQANEDKADIRDTLFSFHPLIQEGEEVLFESYACIKHLSSGEWLHLDKEDKYTRRSFQPNAKGLAGLEWDSAELYKLKTQRDRGDYDSFTLQEVPENLLDNFNFLAGIVPILTSHIVNIKEDGKVVQTEKKLSDIKETLNEVQKWVINDDDREKKNRQKLLRNLKVIEQLAEILHFENIGDIELNQKAICRECYNVIKRYLEGNSRKNENYLAKFIEKFQCHIGKDLNAEEVLIEIVQDNMNFVTRMAETQLDYMIEQFCSTKDPRFLTFLSSLCVCNDRAIPSTQEKLLKSLVMDEGLNIFIKMVVKEIEGQKEVFFYPPENETNLTSMRKLGNPVHTCEKTLSRTKDLSPLMQKNYDLLDAQLFLFTQLCKGNNKESIEALNKYIDFSQAINVVQDMQIDPALRFRYAEIMLVMFVDCGDNRSFLDNLCYSFDYDKIAAEPYSGTVGAAEGETKALTGVENIYFPDLKKWILSVLENHEQLRSDLKSEVENGFLEKVIELLSYLVRYGYYDDLKDVDCCMEHLIRLLNGKTDLPSLERKKSSEDLEKFREKERKENIPENKSIFNVKLKALKVMELFFRFKFYVKLQKFVYDFKVLKGDCEQNSMFDPPPQLMSQLMEKTTKNDQYEPHLIGVAKTRLNTICGKTDKSSGFPPNKTPSDEPDSLESILLDLSTYDCDELVTASLSLLFQMYSFEEELFEKAVKAQLLISTKSINHLENVNKTILPELRQLLRVDLNKQAQNDIRILLDQLSELCGKSNGMIIEQNQVMLDNSGVVSEVLTVLSKADEHFQTVSIDDESRSLTKKVFISCFHLLRRLAAGQKNIKKRLFNHLDDLLKLHVPGEALEFVAKLLTEVFTGGPELVLKVSESLIERIFKIIVDCHSSSTQASFMIALQAIAKVEELDLPVEWNQDIIIKNFCRLRHSFCEELLAEKEGQIMEKKRIDILLKDEECSSQLEVLLRVTELLATCAESRNLFIESVCRKIFTSEELLRIMTNGNIDVERKIPFTKFFMFVYMKESSKQGFEATHGKEMWKYLESIGELLNNFTVVSSSSDDQSISQESGVMVRGGESITGSFEQPIDKTGRELLKYISGSVIPLLHTFYCSIFNPLEEATSKQLEWEYKVSISITKSLYNLSKIDSCNHFLYEEILSKLLEYEKIKVNVDENSVASVFHQRTGQLMRSATVTSSPSPLPESDYDDQDQLNSDFNQYVRNYRSVYQGKNTADCQIKSPVQDLKYSDKGEELPLGQSFQQLVSLFIKSSDELKPEVERLLRQLEISTSTEQLSENDQLAQEALDKRCLQVLRALVINQVKLIDPELKDRDAIKFRKKVNSCVVPIQHQLQNFNNTMKRVTSLLSHSNEEISRGALALMKYLLFSGNREVQESLCCSVKETREETLFLHMKQRIRIEILNYKKTTDLKFRVPENQQEKRQSIHSEKERSNVFTPPDDSNAAKTLLQNKDDSTKQTTVAISMTGLGSVKGDNNSSSDTSSNSSKNGTLQNNTNIISSKRNLDFKDILASDSTWTTLVLEVIGLMCDGQHRALQNYLRDQPDNFKTINVVAEVASLLHTYATTLNSQNLNQVHKILQCLIEMSVGNTANQQVILDKSIIEPLTRILQYSIQNIPDVTASEKEREELVQCVQAKCSVVELISVMMEEIDTEASEVIKGVTAAVDENALIKTIEFLQIMQSNEVIRKKGIDDDCERAIFRAYHVLLTLMDYNKCSYKDTKGLKECVKTCITQDKDEKDKDEKDKIQDTFKCIDKCIDHTRIVEIHYENENSGKSVLAKVHFPYDPENTLREDLIEKVRWNINRDSMEDKQRALLFLMPALKKDINHQSRLKKNKVLKSFLAYHIIRMYILMALTFLMNLFLLTTYFIPDDDLVNDSFIVYPSASRWFSHYVLFIFGVIHLMMSFWIVIEYFLINWPHFQLPEFIYSYMNKLLKYWKHKERYRELPQFTFLDINIFGASTVYMIIFLCCSFLSLIFRGYFYCVCLLFIVYTSDILRRVLRAVTIQGKSLLYVAVLGFIVLFIYSVISFAWLHSYFIPSNGLFCDTLSKCYYSMIRIGLLYTLSSSIPLNSTGVASEYSAPHFPLRLIYDLSFFIIVTTIGLNIVIGIIVDSFGELRGQRSKIEEEQKSQCFVCDLPSYKFERKAKGFRNHVKFDHKMWNYVYYSLYVDKIDPGDRNAIQKYVYEKVKNDIPSFFPQKEARCLSVDDDQTGKKLDKLRKQVEKMIQRLINKDNEKSARAKKTNQLKFEENVKAQQSFSN